VPVVDKTCEVVVRTFPSTVQVFASELARDPLSEYVVLAPALACTTFTPNFVESVNAVAGLPTRALVTFVGTVPLNADTLPRAMVAAAVPALVRVTPVVEFSTVRKIELCKVAVTARVPLDCAIAAIGSNIARAKITSVAFFILFTLLKVLHQS
jgi:hypothetical protein